MRFWRGAASMREHRFAGLAPLWPFLAILVWTCAVRLPFYGNVNDDEFFFAVVAQRWLEGGFPYAASYDVKPPGLFAIYAAAQALFGESLATIKGLEMLFTALGGFGLYRLALRHGTRTLALWCGLLYPVYSLALSGVNAANLILQLPFVIFAFLAGADFQRRRAALLAGLMMGLAGMLRQAVVFETLAVLGLLLWHSEGRRLRVTLSFVAGALLPLAGFAFYFLFEGHLRAAFDAVIVAALVRSGGQLVAADGPGAALQPGAWDVVAGIFAMAPPVLVLWGSSLLACVRWDRLKHSVPPDFLVMAAVWLAAACVDVMTAHTMFAYYLLLTVPPLLLLSGALVGHGLEISGQRRTAWQAALVLLAIFWPLAADRIALFSTDMAGPDDRLAAERAADRLQQLGFQPGDRLLVVNRGLLTYVAAKADPPTAYFHPTHLLCVFPTPEADPLGQALNARPRFVVLGDPAIVRPCEQPARLRRVEAFLKAGYRQVGQVTGTWDRLFIYRLR